MAPRFTREYLSGKNGGPETIGEPAAASLLVPEGQAAETKEVSEGVAFADCKEDGVLLVVELLALCRVEILDQIARRTWNLSTGSCTEDFARLRKEWAKNGVGSSLTMVCQ